MVILLERAEYNKVYKINIWFSDETLNLTKPIYAHSLYQWGE
jgi:hypothetical protein